MRLSRFKLFHLLTFIFLLCFGNTSNSQSWKSIGANDKNIPFSCYTTKTTSFESDTAGKVYAAIVQEYEGVYKIRIRYFDSVWTEFAQPIPVRPTTFIVLKINQFNQPYLLYREQDTIKVQKYNGSAWVKLGNSVSTLRLATPTSEIAFDSLGVPYVAYSDFVNPDSLWVRKYNDTNWIAVGGKGIRAGNYHGVRMRIAKDNSPYILFRDAGNNNKPELYKFNGNTWTPQGPALSAQGTQYMTMELDSSGKPWVAFVDMNSNRLQVWKFDSIWKSVGNLNFGTRFSRDPSLIFDKTWKPFIVTGKNTDIRTLRNNIWEKVDSSNLIWATGSSENKLIIGENNQLIVAGLYRDQNVSPHGVMVQKLDSGLLKILGDTGISSFSMDGIQLTYDTNNLPYIIYRDWSDTNRILVKKYESGKWQYVGSKKITPHWSSQPNIVVDRVTNQLYIHYKVIGDTLRVCKFNGIHWQKIDSTGLSTRVIYAKLAIAPNGDLYLLSLDYPAINQSKLNVRKLVSNQWTLLPAPNINSKDALSIVVDQNNTPYISFNDSATGRVRVLKYSGSSWVAVGSTFLSANLSSQIELRLGKKDKLYLKYFDVLQNRGYVKIYDTTWKELGDLSTWRGSSSGFSIDTSGNPFLAYSYSDTVIVAKLVNNNWINLAPYKISELQTGELALSVDKYQTPAVAFKNYGSWLFSFESCNTVIRTKNVMAYLNNKGQLSLSATLFDSASYSGCGVMSRYLSKNEFTCADTGINSLVFYLKDNLGNIDSSTVTVHIKDTLRSLSVKNDKRFELNNTGQVAIKMFELLDGGLSCGTDTLSLSPSTFTCSDTGKQKLKIYHSKFGVLDSTSVSVIISDKNKPVAQAKEFISVYLDSFGSAQINSSILDDGSFAVCGPVLIRLSKENFSCTDVGISLVNLIVTAQNGISDTTSSSLLVLDTVRPTAKSKNITVYLNSIGQATVSAQDIDDGSIDACGIKSRTISKAVFGVADSGVNLVNLIVTDNNGNSDTSIFQATVLDSLNTSINTLNAHAAFSLVPNPSNEEFKIAIKDYNTMKRLSMRLFNSGGQLLEFYKSINNLEEFSFGKNLVPGVYFVEITSSGGSCYLKLVKY